MLILLSVCFFFAEQTLIATYNYPKHVLNNRSYGVKAAVTEFIVEVTWFSHKIREGHVMTRELVTYKPQRCQMPTVRVRCRPATVQGHDTFSPGDLDPHGICTHLQMMVLFVHEKIERMKYVCSLLPERLRVSERGRMSHALGR